MVRGPLPAVGLAARDVTVASGGAASSEGERAVEGFASRREEGGGAVATHKQRFSCPGAASMLLCSGGLPACSACQAPHRLHSMSGLSGAAECAVPSCAVL